MDRVFNFAAGPSALPLPVLERAQREMCSYEDTGMSVMEMSHRSKAYARIFEHTERQLRTLMQIPQDYAVLFLQGGATLQFSMLPMNLSRRGQKAAYAVTGVFAQKAWEEGNRWCEAVKVTDSGANCFIPTVDPALLTPDMAYLHITGNNTAYGTMYTQTPPHGGLPLVADWSSGILGSVIPVTDYDLIYAGAQKNMGPAGVTVVIVRRALLDGKVDPMVPRLLRYDVMDQAGSMLNTPNTYGIYLCGLVFDWLLDQGGIPAMEKINRRKAALLYDVIDSTDFYTGFAAKADRSLTNITFGLPTEELTARFIAGAAAEGMVNLKGYRAVGGVRASLYNGVPLEAAERLAAFMKQFAKNN